MILSRSGASRPPRMLKEATTSRVMWCRYPVAASRGSSTRTDNQLKQSCMVAPAKALGREATLQGRLEPGDAQTRGSWHGGPPSPNKDRPLTAPPSPPEVSSVPRLHQGHNGVGDGGADVGAHDDGDGRAHLQHWQKKAETGRGGHPTPVPTVPPVRSVVHIPAPAGILATLLTLLSLGITGTRGMCYVHACKLMFTYTYCPCEYVNVCVGMCQ